MNRNLERWIELLLAKESEKAFGRAVVIKLDLLAAQLSGETTVAEIAEKHGVSRECAYKHLRRLKKAYGM